MIVAVLETAENRLDPPRADLGARHIHRHPIVQGRVRPLQPLLREVAVAEHLFGVVRDAGDGERLVALFVIADHGLFYHDDAVARSAQLPPASRESKPRNSDPEPDARSALPGATA